MTSLLLSNLIVNIVMITRNISILEKKNSIL